VRRVFVDVGAQISESLELALKLKHGFDSNHAIGPSSFGISSLNGFHHKHLQIFSIAVSNFNGITKLFRARSVGGSLFEDKNQYWGLTETIQVRKLSE
jgi:hypothetical protein